ncbi:MAG TPA: hypothetical protein VFA12_20115 [Stellaceae bacterium]|nr:hypothetical protein [Stellaceae bacterium]
MNTMAWALVAVWLSSGHVEADLIRYYAQQQDCEYAAKTLSIEVQPMLCLGTTIVDRARR